MRNVFVICIVVLAAYCVDCNYFGGAGSRSGVQMLGQIAADYKQSILRVPAIHEAFLAANWRTER